MAIFLSGFVLGGLMGMVTMCIFIMCDDEGDE